METGALAPSGGAHASPTANDSLFRESRRIMTRLSRCEKPAERPGVVSARMATRHLLAARRN
jgi:hypothetical protein